MVRTRSDALARDWSADGDVREIIEEYLAEDRDRNDENFPHMCDVLRRLADSERAHDAIISIADNARDIWELLDVCVYAEYTMRTFHNALHQTREIVERLPKYRESVETLREFVGDVSEEERKSLCDALNHIGTLIEDRQQTAQEDMLNLGVTRKSRAQTAAEISAIGLLAELVNSAFEKPFAPQVTILAEVALGIDEVTIERVRHALKMRAKKWGSPRRKRRTQRKAK